MRRLTAAVFQSLDGVMQGPGGPEEDPTGSFELGGWSFPLWEDSLLERYDKIMSADYDLLLGRRTYDIFLAYWPYNQEIPVGAKFEQINKYVLTHSDEPLTWQHSHKLSGDTAEVVRELKASEGRDLLIQGSSSLYAPLLSAGLIDKLVLITFPLLLGQGKSIFDAAVKPTMLKVIDHFVSAKGATFATFAPAGEVALGSFESKAPSAVELERRAKIKAGGW